MSVIIDMPKAREIHMARIREARNAELAMLDVAFMRAVESGNTRDQQTVGARKQVLRDIPQKFDLRIHRTPDALASAWPEELS